MLSLLGPTADGTFLRPSHRHTVPVESQGVPVSPTSVLQTEDLLHRTYMAIKYVTTIVNNFVMDLSADGFN